MTDITQIPAELRPAFAIFLKELDTHVSYLVQTVQHMETLADSSNGEFAKDAQILEHRFHLIKGGAGFFKLDEMLRTALRGEEMFKHGEVRSNDHEETLYELKQIVSSFQQQATMLQEMFG